MQNLPNSDGRMAHIESPAYKVVSKKNGRPYRVYYYAWKGRGAPRLKSTPGSKEFITELNAALEGRRVGDKSKVSGLVTAYRADKAYRDLADSTKRNWSRWLDHIRDHFGKLSIRQFDRPEFRADIKKWRDKWRDQPRSADYGMQVLSALLSFAVEEGRLGSNICKGISTVYETNRAEIIWTDADMAALKKQASVEVFRAAQLASLTGLRQGDLLALRWDQISDLAIEKATSKSGGQRSATIPLYRELRKFLATCPKVAETVLATSRGTPWKGWGTDWNKAMRVSGLSECGLRFHDLRGTAATKFFVAGFSEREIAVMLGWSEKQVERIIDRYVRRDAILRDRIERMDFAFKRKRRKSQNAEIT